MNVVTRILANKMRNVLILKEAIPVNAKTDMKNGWANVRTLTNVLKWGNAMLFMVSVLILLVAILVNVKTDMLAMERYVQILTNVMSVLLVKMTVVQILFAKIQFQAIAAYAQLDLRYTN